MLDIMSSAMPCLDLHVCMHILCSYAFTCLYAWICVLPCFYAYIHMLRCTFTCLHAYLHAYMCRSVYLHALINVFYVLYAISHVLYALFMCLGLDLFCHAMCYCSPFVPFIAFSCVLA